MKLLSINVARPRIILIGERQFSTGIFKEPVTGPVMLRRLNLDGDRQADLSVHGGPSKAVYAYPSEQYPYWREVLPDMKLPYGMFGENFTTEGMKEEEMNIGDQFRIGESVVMVTQPREPCFKLAAKFRRDDIIKKFFLSGRSGFYFSVVQEGMAQAGDEIQAVHRDANRVSIANINGININGVTDAEMLRRALRIEALPEGYRNYFLQELQSLEASSSIERK